MKKCNFSFLLEETPETYYWIGFLLADGYFSLTNRIKLTLSIIDLAHLEKFAKLSSTTINFDKQKTNCTVCGMDTLVVKKIKHKFNISNNKTIVPPLLKINNIDLLLSLLIGFIDGDGHITNQTNRKDSKICIKVHRNWISFLELYKQICPSVKIKINNCGYAFLSLTKNKEIIELKKNAQKLKLPILERKWSKIDLDFISKQDVAIERRKNVYQLYDSGMRIKDITKTLNLTKGCVQMIIRRKKSEVNI